MSPFILLLLIPVFLLTLRLTLTLAGWLIWLLCLIAMIALVHLLLVWGVDPLIFQR